MEAERYNSLPMMLGETFPRYSTDRAQAVCEVADFLEVLLGHRNAAADAERLRMDLRDWRRSVIRCTRRLNVSLKSWRRRQLVVVSLSLPNLGSHPTSRCHSTLYRTNRSIQTR